VQDSVSLVFGGSESAAACVVVESLGGLDQKKNGEITRIMNDILSTVGVPADRTYVEFVDIPRTNLGFNGRTFAD
jgi:phenylpyruvate tautomerase